MSINVANGRQRISVLLFLLFSFLCYSFYLYYHLPVKSISQHPEAATGKLSWQKYNCNACHQIYGLGGYLGPDLTNVYSKRGPDYIKAFLKNGTSIMPAFHLTEQETKDLVSFLKDIDASGSSDPKTFTSRYDGNIEQQ